MSTSLPSRRATRSAPTGGRWSATSNPSQPRRGRGADRRRPSRQGRSCRSARGLRAGLGPEALCAQEGRLGPGTQRPHRRGAGDPRRLRIARPAGRRDRGARARALRPRLHPDAGVTVRGGRPHAAQGQAGLRRGRAGPGVGHRLAKAGHRRGQVGQPQARRARVAGSLEMLRAGGGATPRGDESDRAGNGPLQADGFRARGQPLRSGAHDLRGDPVAGGEGALLSQLRPDDDRCRRPGPRAKPGQGRARPAHPARPGLVAARHPAAAGGDRT